MNPNRREKKRKCPPGFGDRLSALLWERDVNVYQMERETGVHHSNIISYTREEMLPSAYNLWALCNYLHVSSDWLLGLSDTKELTIRK